MDRRETITFGLTLVAVVVVPGLADAILANFGHATLGSVVWAVGYGTGALLIWYVWIRPLEISAPDGAGTEDDGETG